MYSFDLKVYFKGDLGVSLLGLGGVNLERFLALYVEYNVMCDEESTVTRYLLCTRVPITYGSSAMFENLIKEKDQILFF